ncbi:hypothetical protein CNR22_20705 [Sphingobacteriaceae bacterium]|nr:hypothetical protein CNR22_20705 [Sphingobacteriaceae bacterium]
MLRFFTICFLCVCLAFKANAQCNVTVSSTDGYNVNVRVALVSVIPSSNSCPWGYNYNLVVTYTVAFTGSNIPGSLYTLQGNFTCNGQNLFFDLPNNAATGSYTTGTNPYIASDGNNIYTTHPSCTAANPSNLNCGTITVDINGPGINNQTVNCNSSVVPLPIGLAYFSGAYTKTGIILSWQTQTETENSFFTVEKSEDGIEWVPLTNIPGAGNSQVSKQYSFLDAKPYAGINYYRLKQTDIDQKFSYSSVIAVMNASEKISCSKIWPNPASSDVNFEITSPSNGNATYEIINEIGSIANNGALAYFTGKNEMKISTENLPAGYYVLRLAFPGELKVHYKLVKI